jgi:hypothetical protein
LGAIFNHKISLDFAGVFVRNYLDLFHMDCEKQISNANLERRDNLDVLDSVGLDSHCNSVADVEIVSLN